MKIGFTDKEARGVIYLLIIISVIVGAKFFYDHIEQARFYQYAEEMVEELPEESDQRQLALFEFDPNTATLQDLMRLGLEKSEAVSIIRYRSYGKVFRIKEDLFTCYGISDSLYYALEPYITIADTFKVKKFEPKVSSRKNYAPATTHYERKLLQPSEFSIDTVGVKYLVAIGALTRRQAEVFVRWRNRSGIYNMDELRECYVVSDSIASALEPYIQFPEYEEPRDTLIDINKADSAALRSIYGVGAKSVAAIIDFRQKLGGFYSVDQLSQLKVINESNFCKIIKQISCDSCDISKIDVNFASAKIMKGHPYIIDKVLRRLLNKRQLKGGWSTIEEMIDDEIFTVEEAARVRPYLIFNKFTVPCVVDRGFE